MGTRQQHGHPAMDIGQCLSPMASILQPFLHGGRRMKRPVIQLDTGLVPNSPSKHFQPVSAPRVADAFADLDVWLSGLDKDRTLHRRFETPLLPSPIADVMVRFFTFAKHLQYNILFLDFSLTF